MKNKRSTILLVEDTPTDVIFIQRAFQDVNLVNYLQVVSDGEQAIAYLSGAGVYANRACYELPALILLDLKLPRKNGFEVLEWLRQQPGLRRLPVVVLTSSDDSSDIARAYDQGANSYLVKPFAYQKLVEMVMALKLFWVILAEPPEIDAADLQELHRR
ncbi:MAG: response regulator [Chloroflexota bacterium]